MFLVGPLNPPKAGSHEAPAARHVSWQRAYLEGFQISTEKFLGNALRSYKKDTSLVSASTHPLVRGDRGKTWTLGHSV